MILTKNTCSHNIKWKQKDQGRDTNQYQNIMSSQIFDCADKKQNNQNLYTQSKPKKCPELHYFILLFLLSLIYLTMVFSCKCSFKYFIYEKIFQMPVPPKFNESKYMFTDKNNVPNNLKTTAVFTSAGRYDLLEDTLLSFFQFSTFPYEDIIVVEDGNFNSQLGQLMNKFSEKDIKWIITGQKVGQLKSIDFAYLFVKTPYIFHSQDDWQFLKKGFVEISLWRLENDPNLINFWLRKHNGPLDPKTNKSLTSWTLSFNPGLIRMSDYKQIQSYSKFTNNKSFGYGAGEAELDISIYFHNTGRYSVQSQIQYIRHTGNDKRTLKKFRFDNNIS